MVRFTTRLGMCWLVALLPGPQALLADGLRVGTAWADITPPLGHAMWGYAARRDAPSVGVLDRLKSRAVVLETGKVRLAIVSLDLGRPPTRQSAAAIRARAKSAGIDHLLLVASHTHHGPVLEVDDWPTREKPYTRELEVKLGDIILQAAKNCVPARLGITMKEVAFNRNRHSKRAERPIDPELSVVRIESPAGKIIAHLVNFAAHPTMLSRDLNKFSADYPGVLAHTVEDQMGGLCLFLQGACGDLSPHPQGQTGHEAFGQMLADEVLKMSRDIRCTAAENARLQVREHAFRFAKRIDLGNPFVRAAASAAFFEKLVDFYEREYREGVRPELTTALLNDEIGLVGVSGEFFSGHAVSLKKRARLPHLLFLGYCNDFQQYFPTIEAVAEGGYGTDPITSPVEVGAGEQIINRALIDLYELRGQIRRPGEK